MNRWYEEFEKCTWENRDSSKGGRVPKEIGWTLGRTIETRVYRENWVTEQEYENEEEIQRDTGGPAE